MISMARPEEHGRRHKVFLENHKNLDQIMEHIYEPGVSLYLLHEDTGDTINCLD